MATGGVATEVENASINLKQFFETRYQSKNDNLKSIITELPNREVPKQPDILHMIRTNDWVYFDKKIINTGQKFFWILLQQLFLYKYFLPDDEKITRKQFEIAMGIQQVRWMANPNNCRDYYFKKSGSKNYEENRSQLFYTIHSAKLHIWETLDAAVRSKIVAQLRDKLQTRRTDNDTTDLDAFLRGSVWYFVLPLDRFGKETMIGGGWQGFGPDKENYFPIPETLNFSSIACVYAPKLIFGSLSEVSLLKYIMEYRERPYAAHLPDAQSNLCVIHNQKNAICANWMHDFHHSRSMMKCDRAKVIGYSLLNQKCKLLGSNIVTTENLLERLHDPSSQLSVCLKTPNPSDEATTMALASNDTGLIWHDNIVRGGRRFKKTRIHRRKKARHTRRNRRGNHPR